MFAKLFIGILIYLAFVMVRGMWRTYKLLYSRGSTNTQFADRKENKQAHDKETFEADYKIIK